MTEDVLKVLQTTFLVILFISIVVMLLTGLNYEESVAITVKFLSASVFMLNLLHPIYKSKEKIKGK